LFGNTTYRCLIRANCRTSPLPFISAFHPTARVRLASWKKKNGPVIVAQCPPASLNSATSYVSLVFSPKSICCATPLSSPSPPIASETYLLYLDRDLCRRAMPFCRKESPGSTLRTSEPPNPTTEVVRASTSRAPRRRFHINVALVCCGSRQSRLSKFLSLHDYITVERHGGGSALTAPRTHIITKQGQHSDEATSVPPNAASRRHPFHCTASPPCLAC
jgi:hypothetical protein